MGLETVFSPQEHFPTNIFGVRRVHDYTHGMISILRELKCIIPIERQGISSKDIAWRN
jgi:hypothetical protein